MKPIFNLGIIGISEGNGHPYSWAAICNGYNPRYMDECPFPVIPAYLKEQPWPEAKIPNASVTHIWTQSQTISEHIAQASNIEHIETELESLIGKVDGVLLARDDAENHKKMAMPFLEAGLPIFIDKPLALNREEAQAMLAAQRYEGQLFSCSSLRFARELELTPAEKEEIGQTVFIETSIPKSWEKYAVHLIEPIVAFHPGRGALQEVYTQRINNVYRAAITWRRLKAFVHTYDAYSVPLQISYFGEKGVITKTLKDTFNAFKRSIQSFIDGMEMRHLPIPRQETMEIIQIIEQGLHA